jgi:hypothetical protein
MSQLTPNSVRLWVDTHDHNTSMRNPFFYDLEGNISYCINIFIRDVYWGMVSLGGVRKETASCDTIIFDYFYNLLMKAVKNNDHNNSSSMITLKSVLTDLLTRGKSAQGHCPITPPSNPRCRPMRYGSAWGLWPPLIRLSIPRKRTVSTNP